MFTHVLKLDLISINTQFTKDCIKKKTNKPRRLDPPKRPRWRCIEKACFVKKVPKNASCVDLGEVERGIGTLHRVGISTELLNAGGLERQWMKQ